VKCWGNNGSGQLGDGTKTSALQPVDVVGLGGAAVAITAGGLHSCAILTSGETKCWGDPYGTAPVSVAGLAANTQTLSGGGSHTCALAGAGRMKCWGSDWGTALGVGRFSYSKTPVNVVERLPQLAIGYAGVMPGSKLTLMGWHYPAGGFVDLYANGQLFAAGIPVNASGEFVVFLDTTPANSGSYRIEAVSGAHTAYATAFLGGQWSLKGLEGGGAVYSLPAGIGGEVYTQHIAVIAR
jgi:hypothetical protein